MWELQEKDGSTRVARATNSIWHIVPDPWRNYDRRLFIRHRGQRKHSWTRCTVMGTRRDDGAFPRRAARSTECLFWLESVLDSTGLCGRSQWWLCCTYCWWLDSSQGCVFEFRAVSRLDVCRCRNCDYDDRGSIESRARQCESTKKKGWIECSIGLLRGGRCTCVVYLSRSWDTTNSPFECRT